MSLINRIKDTLNNARTASVRNEPLIALLTTFYSESRMVGKNDGDRETTDADVIKIANKFLAGIKAIREHAKDRKDLIEQCDFEASVLNEYIPKQLTNEELKSKVVYYLGTNPGANMGAIMAHFKANWNGQYDGKVLSNIVKESMN